MNFSNTLKSHLLSLIEEMASHPQDFTKNPKTDFSRTKKWSFKKTILFMLSMEGNSLKNELLKFFDFNAFAFLLFCFCKIYSELYRRQFSIINLSCQSVMPNIDNKENCAAVVKVIVEIGS